MPVTESSSLLLRFCRPTLTRHEPFFPKMCSTSRLELEKSFFFRSETELPPTVGPYGQNPPTSIQLSTHERIICFRV